MDVGVGVPVCSLWFVGYIQARQTERPVLFKVQFQQDLCSPLFPTIPRNVHFKRKILVIRSSEGRENHQSWDVILCVCGGAGLGPLMQNVWSQPACGPDTGDILK